MPPSFGQECGLAEMREDGRGNATSTEEVNNSHQAPLNKTGVVRRRREHSLLQVRSPETGGSRGWTTWERLKGLSDI